MRMTLACLLTVGLFVGLSEGQDKQDKVTVKGSVSLKTASGKDPKRRPIDVSSDAFCKHTHGDDNPLYSEEVICKNGKLANVFVYVKNAPAGNYAAPADPVVLDQKGCQYVPHVFGIMVGQKLLVRNSDATTHNVHKLPSANPEFNKGQDKGAPDLEFTFNEPAFGAKAEKFKCDIHGWMGAWMHVMPHPFFGVSKEDGSFEIKDLPPGEYEIVAWHEKYGELEPKKVKLPDEKDKVLEFVFEQK